MSENNECKENSFNESKLSDIDREEFIDTINHLKQLAYKSEALKRLEFLIELEMDIDAIFNNYGTLIKFIDKNTIKEIKLLSTYVKKNIYAIQFIILSEDSNCFIKYEENSELFKLIELIKDLQSYYIKYLSFKFNSNKLEVFDTIQTYKYQNNIEQLIKTLHIK